MENCAPLFMNSPLPRSPCTALAVLAEVFLRRLRVRLDGVAARTPVCGTDLAVLLGELESIDQSQRLVDGTTDGEVVDGDLPC